MKEATCTSETSVGFQRTTHFLSHKLFLNIFAKHVIGKLSYVGCNVSSVSWWRGQSSASLERKYIAAYISVAKQCLCEQRPLLGNTRNIHARNNRTIELCNPVLSNGLVNMFHGNEHQSNSRRTMFYMWSVPRCYMQERLNNERSPPRHWVRGGGV
jgi:hypothetical protein